MRVVLGVGERVVGGREEKGVVKRLLYGEFWGGEDGGGVGRVM